MNYFIVLCIVLVANCTSFQKKEELKMDFYSFQGNLVYSILENDIECFDWRHQSVLVTDEIKEELSDRSELLKGKMKLKIGSSILYEVDIISESINYEFGTPKIIFEEKGLLFFKGNWFVIRYLKNKYELKDGEPEYFAELANEQLFNHLKAVGKLNCDNWTIMKDFEAECCDFDLDPRLAVEKYLEKN